MWKWYRYLASNRITSMANVSCLTSLEVLDLGYNNIREIEGLENLKSLKELYLGKNKIESMKVLE